MFDSYNTIIQENIFLPKTNTVICLCMKKKEREDRKEELEKHRAKPSGSCGSNWQIWASSTW